LDVEAMTLNALDKAHAQAVLASDREHVTPYIRHNKNLFRQANIRSHVDLSAVRWTVDYDDDLALVRTLVESTKAHVGVVPDRFDFLRALERLGAAGSSNNAHARNESFSDGEICS
jgi:spore coat polysaccharide biosynthesis protein SpsF (cytidylyltransferase family)